MIRDALNAGLRRYEKIQSVKKRIKLPVCRLLYNKLCFFVYF